MKYQDLSHKQLPEGDVVPFKRRDWQALPQQVRQLSAEWYWAHEVEDGPEMESIAAQLATTGFLIDYDYDGDNIELTNKKTGRKFLLPLADADNFTGWAQGTEPGYDTMSESLRDWFKQKWVRFGPDGKIRGACARGSDSEGKPKCLPQKKAHALGKKGRKYAASKKRREDPNPERRGKAKNVATKKKSNEGVAEGNLKEFAPYSRDDDGDSRDIDPLREKIYSLLMKKLANVKGNPQDIAMAAMEVADDIASESEFVDFTKLPKWVEMVLNKVQGMAEASKNIELNLHSDIAQAIMQEKWSAKYKRSINCNNPKGFSQRAHCQGRKKTRESRDREILDEQILEEAWQDLLNKFKQVAQGFGGHLRDAFVSFQKKAATEMQEFSTMISVYNKEVRGQTVSQAEIKEANKQLFDFLKLAGLTGIYAILYKVYSGMHLDPAVAAGVGILPALSARSLLKLLVEYAHKEYNINLLPSSFTPSSDLRSVSKQDLARELERRKRRKRKRLEDNIDEGHLPWVLRHKKNDTIVARFKDQESAETQRNMLPIKRDQFMVTYQTEKQKRIAKGLHRTLDICPECGGELVSEDQINEKQDACYRKVKSRYKVWPSAYASGALVQCRKKGAKNWGKKTESLESGRQPLSEGGNVFKTADKTPLTRRIATSDVPDTVKFLEKITGLDFTSELEDPEHLDPGQTARPRRWLGTTGRKQSADGVWELNSSGDLDLSVDSTKHSKQEVLEVLIRWCKSQGIPDKDIMNIGTKKTDGWIKDAGDNLHFKTPILGDPAQGFVQTDFMFSEDPEFQQLSMLGGAGQYRGEHRHILLASIARARGLKYSPKFGLLDASTEQPVPQGKNWDHIAKTLLAPDAGIRDIRTVDRIIAKIITDPRYEELVAAARDTLGRQGVTLPVKESFQPGTAAWMRRIMETLR